MACFFRTRPNHSHHVDFIGSQLRENLTYCNDIQKVYFWWRTVARYFSTLRNDPRSNNENKEKNRPVIDVTNLWRSYVPLHLVPLQVSNEAPLRLEIYVSDIDPQWSEAMPLYDSITNCGPTHINAQNLRSYNCDAIQLTHNYSFRALRFTRNGSREQSNWL